MRREYKLNAYYQPMMVRGSGRYKERAGLYDCMIDLNSRTVRMPKVTYLQSMTEWYEARAIIIGKINEEDKHIIQKVLKEWASRMMQLMSTKWNKLNRGSGGMLWCIDNTLAGQAHCNLKLHCSGGEVQFAY